MSTLKQKAQQILYEKEEKIIPENFSNNLAIFDVSGALNEFPFTNADDLYGQITINEGTDEDTSGNSYRSIQLMGRDIRNYDKYIVDNNGGNDVVINMHSTSLAQSVGLTPEKIKKDETILGVTGTYEGSGSQITLPPYYILRSVPIICIDTDGLVLNSDYYMFVAAFNSSIYNCPIIGDTGHNEYLKAIVEDSSKYAGGNITLPIKEQLDYYDKLVSVKITTNTIPTATYANAYQLTSTKNEQTSFNDNVYLEEISTGNIVYFPDVTLFVQNKYNP